MAELEVHEVNEFELVRQRRQVAGAIGPGTRVELEFFSLVDHDLELVGRMTVEVTSQAGNQFAGRVVICPVPLQDYTGLSVGMSVEFTRSEVRAILF